MSIVYISNMDLQPFLSLERKQLEHDRHRLSAAIKTLENNTNKNNAPTSCPAAFLMQMEGYKPGQCHRMANTSSKCNEPANASNSTLATTSQNSEQQLELSEAQAEAESESQEQQEGSPSIASLVKSAKEFVNQRELLIGSARQYKSPNASQRNLESERPQSENRLPIGRRTGGVSG